MQDLKQSTVQMVKQLDEAIGGKPKEKGKAVHKSEIDEVIKTIMIKTGI